MKVGDKIYCSKSWGGGTYWTITKGKSYTISELYDFHYKTEACIYIICDTGNKLVFMLNNSLPGVLYYNDYFYKVLITGEAPLLIKLNPKYRKEKIERTLGIK